MANFKLRQTGEQIQKDLDKIEKDALVKPASAPSDTAIVSVDNTNTQTMLTVGDGLSVENGELKATGGLTDIQQTTGQSTTAVMSQKATTVEINALKSDLENKASKDYVDKAIASISGGMPNFVDSVDEMTDTSKVYVLNSTGNIWVYKSVTTEQEVTVTDQIEGVEENPYYDNSRLPSSGTTVTSASGYVVTPYIDLTKVEYQGKTIQIHLDGNRYFSENAETYIQFSALNVDKSICIQRYTSNLQNFPDTVNVVSVKINSPTSSTITLEIPAKTTGSSPTTIGYIRFCGQGTVEASNIYITYQDTQTVTREQWVDTGVRYGGSGLDEETAAKISELNNEGSDPSTIKLLSAPVLDFYNSAAYPDDDYTVTHLPNTNYPCRADIPVPFTVKWEHNENAMRTTVAVSTTVIETPKRLTMMLYDATGFDNYPIYNLLPNTTYYYQVTHVLSDGSLVVAKNGRFTTSVETWRLLYIDGTQNVRDLGGWTGLNGKKVKYGKIIRGASLSDTSASDLVVTGKGRLALGEMKVQAELNLGDTSAETSISSTCAYKKLGYSNYAVAITNESARTNFKTILEWIVSCLNGTIAVTGLPTIARNIYIHCQGGCDRTGTLSFLLLGLLGVSESDLAKEYELSSFSNIGVSRKRNTTLAVDVYDYVGMVEALKTYSGDTITDKFVDFATTGCGISTETITRFRNLMLE